MLGGARYWNQELDLSLQVAGNLKVDVTAEATVDPADILRHTVIGYRALAVDYSENGSFGKNGIDFVEHGPVMGVKFRW